MKIPRLVHKGTSLPINDPESTLIYSIGLVRNELHFVLNNV